MPAIPAVVFAFVDGEANAATCAEVCAFVFQPMVRSPTGDFANAPRKDTTSGVTYVNATVVPINKHKKIVLKKLNFRSKHYSYLETARAVTEAGSALSFRSYAVCIVNLLRKTS